MRAKEAAIVEQGMSFAASPLVRVYTGDPLCRSVDFMYTRRIAGGERLYQEFSSLPEASGASPFILFLSTVFWENLSRELMHEDHPEWAGTYLLDRIGEDLAAFVRRGQAKIVIDYSGEASVVDQRVLEAFHRELAARGFDAANVGLITSNHAFAEAYEGWAAQAGLTPVRAFSYNHFVYHFAGSFSLLQGGEKQSRAEVLEKARQLPPKKKFVCLNNMPRTQRLHVVSWIVSNGHLRDGHVSCLHIPEAQFIEAVWSDVETYGGVRREAFDWVLENTPILADVDTSETRGNLAGLLGGLTMYADTAFSLVTESEFSQGEVRRITEKVLKPLANMQPMLLVASPGSLDILRDEGFRTFSPWIDESYDRIEDVVLRMRAVLAETERLLALSPDGLRSMNIALLDTLRHNYELMWSKAQEGYVDLPIHAQLRTFVES
jgi:hypothetical protein